MTRGTRWRMRPLLMAGALLFPVVGFSQQSRDTSSTQDPGSTNPPVQAPAPDTATAPVQSQPIPPGGQQGLFARALNSASPLAGENGPLQWGWLSVRSLAFLQYFGSVTFDEIGTPPANQNVNSSQFTAAIVLSHTFGSSHLSQFTLQYTPSLFITEGHVYTNALNQSAGLDTGFQMGPRWSLQISDRLSYLGSQRYFAGLSLNADYSLGSVNQNTFLNGPGTVIYNSVAATFTYLWSPTTTVSFAPTFGYQDATSLLRSNQNLTSYYRGGRMTVSHSISATQTIGVSYWGQYASYTNPSTTAGPLFGGWQQDAFLTYGQQFAASWRLNLGLGFTGNTGGYSQTGLAASAGLMKSFQYMDFTLSYYRGHQFNGYITSGSSDRVDLVNTIRWSNRFSTSTSASYFKGSNSPSPGLRGSYATEQLSFALTPSVRFTSGVSYTNQTGDGAYVQSSHGLLGTVGLAWAPRAAQAK